jgi:hypothetical protein
MTLEELKSLRHEELVVFTKVDKLITDYSGLHQMPKWELIKLDIQEYEIGDELEFMDIYTKDKHGREVVNFYRKVPGEIGVIAHFCYSVCDYIERKVKLERDNKLISLGI